MTSVIDIALHTSNQTECVMAGVVRTRATLNVTLTNINTVLIVLWTVKVDQRLLEWCREIIEIKNVRLSEEGT